MRTKDQEIADLKDELDKAMSNLARLARENYGLKTSYNKTYTRLRTLENAVRVAVDPASGVSLLDSLMRLSRLIPRKPRPTLREQQRRMHAKVSR